MRFLPAFLAATASVVAVFAAPTTLAQPRAGDYPSKPIRIVVPYAPGGAPTCWRASSRNTWASA